MFGGNSVFIVDGVRTPFLKARTGPGNFRAVDLAVQAGQSLLQRQPLDPVSFDEVILGCVAPTADEANIARIASLRLGCGDSTPAWTVARNCASGMQAIDAAAANIALGRSNLVLAGGTESMSHTPVMFSVDFVRWLGAWNAARSPLGRLQTLASLRPGHLTPVIGLLRGLTDPYCGLNMGQTAEQIANRFDITREAMDAYSVRSHERLGAAIDSGVFEDELTAIFDNHGNSYLHDDGLRRDSSLEKLSRLKPVFDKPAGRVTAGNSAQITDGCALVMLASEHAIAKYGLKPRARIVDSCWAGVDPSQMGLGPVHASTPLLQRHKLGLNDLDSWEINEAFSGQVLACLAAWESRDYCQSELDLEGSMGILDQEKLNPDGGGISIGHPVGASGARIVLHAMCNLERIHGKRAIATLCIGGGQGGAMMIEREG